MYLRHTSIHILYYLVKISLSLLLYTFVGIGCKSAAYFSTTITLKLVWIRNFLTFMKKRKTKFIMDTKHILNTQFKD